MPTLKPIPGSDKPRPLKSDFDEQRYTPTPRRIALPVPEIGIFEEPYRCIRVNKEWWAHVSGMIDVLSSPELWQGTDDEKVRALREIAALLAYDDCEGFGMTPEELKNAVCEALECWTENTALKLISGVTSDIVIDEDGNVTVGGSDEEDAGLPEDDPATGIDETEAARYGASVQIGEKIELFLDKVDDYYGAVNGTPVVPEADAVIAIKNYFPTDADIDTGMAAYYTYRAANPRILFDPAASFYQYLYCNGNGEFAVKRFFVDASGFAVAKANVTNGLISGLSQQFFDDNFEIGAKVPSNAYLDAPCVPIAFQSFLDVPFASARNTTPMKALHRMKFKITGHYEDPDGDIQDAFWYRTAAGVLTRSNPNFVHGAGSNMPSDNQVVYNSAHSYEFTIDLSNLNNFMTITFIKNAGMAAGSTSPTSGFDVEITDLGLAVSQ